MPAADFEKALTARRIGQPGSGIASPAAETLHI
jgi:hypothetical protein